jgi:hypothetical protein
MDVFLCGFGNGEGKEGKRLKGEEAKRRRAKRETEQVAILPFRLFPF